MIAPEPSTELHSVRVYVLRLRRDPEGEILGQVMDPATMQRWTFRGFEELRQILEGTERRDETR